MAAYCQAVRHAELSRRLGWVRELRGLAVEAEGPDAAVGEMCQIRPRSHSRGDEPAARVCQGVLAEVVGIRGGRTILMPYGSTAGIGAGSEVRAIGQQSSIGVGDALLGRVIDSFGQPLDGGAPLALPRRRSLKSLPINPMQRPRIDKVLETGIRAIDGLLTIGQGQRVGVFAGSGVGKSTLLGLIAKHVQKDKDAQGASRINVIALIGERGREVREFIEKQLGTEGLRRSVVVVATSDQPALARIRAAYAALAIAEHFRDGGLHVVLTMDSITRFAMARREVGLSASEPPTARGYTPSVFAELPELCERCGTAPSGGSITALLTVLVEGDDMNEPIADSLRSILDGHIVLSRHIAHRGQYPAIDVLKSASRLMPDLATDSERMLAIDAIKQLAVLEQNRQMVDIGAYERGGNKELDHALMLDSELRAWLSQSDEGTGRAPAIQQLRRIVQLPAAGRANG